MYNTKSVTINCSTIIKLLRKYILNFTNFGRFSYNSISQYVKMNNRKNGTSVTVETKINSNNEYFL